MEYIIQIIADKSQALMYMIKGLDARGWIQSQKSKFLACAANNCRSCDAARRRFYTADPGAKFLACDVKGPDERVMSQARSYFKKEEKNKRAHYNISRSMLSGFLSAQHFPYS